MILLESYEFGDFVRIQSEFSQNSVRIQSEFSQNSVRIQAEFRQNSVYIIRIQSDSVGISIIQRIL